MKREIAPTVTNPNWSWDHESCTAPSFRSFLAASRRRSTSREWSGRRDDRSGLRHDRGPRHGSGLGGPRGPDLLLLLSFLRPEIRGRAATLFVRSRARGA